MSRLRRAVRQVLRGVGWGFLILMVIPAIVLRVADALSWSTVPAASPVSGQLPAAPPSVRIHLHVHTGVSHDAVGTRGDVARAARASGVDGVWISDHLPRVAAASSFEGAELDPWAEGGELPEGVPAPTPPAWMNGVLLVEGREFTVAPDVGRVLVFGVDTVFARWDGGMAPLVSLIERSPESFAMVTHGRGARERDLWRAGHPEGIHGWEALTLSDAGRRRTEEIQAIWRLPTALISLLVGRFHHSLAGALREGAQDPGILAFDSLAADGRLALLGAGNAHPKLNVFGALIPSYASSFRALSTHVELADPLPRDPVEARNAIHRSMREARTWVSILDGEGARGFQLTVTGGEGIARIGETIRWEPGLTLRTGFAGSGSERRIVRVIRDGSPVHESTGSEAHVPLDSPGVYRVEVERYRGRWGRLFLGRRLWIVSSPVWVVAGNGPEGHPGPVPGMENSAEFR